MIQLLVPLFVSVLGAAATVHFLSKPAPPSPPAETAGVAEAPDPASPQRPPPPAPPAKKTGDVETRFEIEKPSSAPEIFRDCEDTIARHCPEKELIPLARCLERHKDSADRYCRQRIEKVNALVLPCAEDIPRLCADAGLGGGRIHKCLAEEVARASKACRAAFLGGKN